MQDDEPAQTGLVEGPRCESHLEIDLTGCRKSSSPRGIRTEPWASFDREASYGKIGKQALGDGKEQAPSCGAGPAAAPKLSNCSLIPFSLYWLCPVLYLVFARYKAAGRLPRQAYSLFKLQIHSGASAQPARSGFKAPPPTLKGININHYISPSWLFISPADYITSRPSALRTAFSSSQSLQAATAMFSLFPQLPIDIRRKIWLTTLGPMTITLTQAGPPPAERLEHSESSPTPCLLEESRYVGNVSLPDGSYKLFFAVKPSAAYLACKESRAFLHYIFAEPVKPDGGLPSWFDLTIDTVRFKRRYLVPLSRHPWFKQAQHLWIRLYYDAGEYLSSGCYTIPEYEDKNHRWLENNLASLKSITFEMVRVSGEGMWVNEWFPVFETWFNHARWDPVSFTARVICYQSDTPEEEWLTPQNYLRVEKQVNESHFQHGFGVPNWREMIECERTRCLIYATDEELENPGEFLRKHQHFGA